LNVIHGAAFQVTTARIPVYRLLLEAVLDGEAIFDQGGDECLLLRGQRDLTGLDGMLGHGGGLGLGCLRGGCGRGWSRGFAGGLGEEILEIGGGHCVGECRKMRKVGRNIGVGSGGVFVKVTGVGGTSTGLPLRKS